MNWSTNVYLKQNWIGERMSFDRYKELNQNIRFSSKSFSSDKKEDKYNDFFKSIINNSNLYYKASNIKSIDESMVKFSGRAKYKIYMKNKPIKWGFKFYVVCDSLNGFCLDIFPHIGSQKFTTSLVISFLLQKIKPGDYLFMDRYYSGIDIYLGLYERGIKATGTLLPNRASIPLDKVSVSKLKQNETKMLNYENKLRILIWQDKKPVYMISNVYDGSLISKNKFDYYKNRLNIMKIPYMISEYNKYMGGVDRMDHNISTYISSHRSKKWYKRIIVYLINVALNNANIIYNLYLVANNRANERLKPLDFRLSILGIKDIKNKNNKVNSSKFIPKEPKKSNLLEIIKKEKQKGSDFEDNSNLDFCLHEPMDTQRECYICREEEPLINSRLIRTKFGCRLHNEWICRKKRSHWKFHMLEYYNFTKK
jgi:hypothetical protein